MTWCWMKLKTLAMKAQQLQAIDSQSQYNRVKADSEDDSEDGQDDDNDKDDKDDNGDKDDNNGDQYY